MAFNTRTLPCLQEFRTDFYACKPNSSSFLKIVPKNLYDYLNYEMLAHWIMGDGTRKENAKVLKTDSFSVQDVVFIMNVFLIKFDIKSTIHYPRNLPVIYIKTASKNRIRDKLIPFMCKSKLYKIEKR